MSQNSEIQALISLLDDEDEVVVENVTNKLLSYGEAVVFNLETAWETNVNPILQERIEDLIQKINFKQVHKDLKSWINQPLSDLYNGAVIVAKYQFPDLDSESVRTSIEGIKQKIWLELNNDLTPLETVSIFNQIFYGQFGFQGTNESAHDINEFCINNVLESKNGSPVVLGIIYIIIAQELNLPIYGVNLYNHFALSFQKKFIVNYKEKNVNDSMFYINPINKGSVFGRQEIINYLEKIKVEKENKYFEPANQTGIIKELLAYIKLMYKSLNEEDKADEIQLLMELF